MENSQQIIEKMKFGDVDIIEQNIESDVPILVLNAIIFGTQKRIKSEAFISGLKSAVENHEILMGKKINDFAIAALHILNEKKYVGSNEVINELIKSKMNY